MHKKISLLLSLALVLSLSFLGAVGAGAKQDDFINPPVNPLPSMFNVSVNGDNDVPTVPPPINPLPAKDVFVQQTPSSPESTKSSKAPYTPPNTQTAKLKNHKSKKHHSKRSHRNSHSHKKRHHSKKSSASKKNAYKKKRYNHQKR